MHILWVYAYLDLLPSHKRRGRFVTVRIESHLFSIANLEGKSQSDLLTIQGVPGWLSNILSDPIDPAFRLGYRCADGYYGNPTVPGATCVPCNCSGNVDPLEAGHCDSVTGECLKCLWNTDGAHCERCADGFYGDAVTAKNCRGECLSKGVMVLMYCHVNLVTFVRRMRPGRECPT